jgi:CHAD domain-containing protein
MATHMAMTEELHQLAITARQVFAAAARIVPVPPTWAHRAAGHHVTDVVDGSI